MKIRSIIAFIFIALGSGEKLTEDENKRRLQNCGRKVDIPYNHPTDVPATKEWRTYIGVVDDRNFTHSIIESAGFFISDRHVFTSSQVVLTSERKWAVDGIIFDQCSDAKPYFDLPENVLQTLRVSGKRSKGLKRGRIFECNYDDYDRMYQPLLLELDIPKETQKDYLCLPNESFDSSSVDGQEADAYGLDGGNMKVRNVKMIEIADKRWIVTPGYNTAKDRGGPLVKEIDGRAVAIGMKALSERELSPEKWMYFFYLKFIEDEICDYAGICLPPPPTTTTEPPPTTTSLTTTGNSVSVQTTASFPNVTVPREKTPRENSSVTRHPITKRPRKMKQPDQSYLDGEEDEEEVQKDDGRFDFFVEEDFVNGSGGKGVYWELILIFSVLAFWY